MKIAWITNSPTMPTGFGQQASLVIEEMQNRGHECIVICRPHMKEERICEEIHVGHYFWESIEKELERIRPDAVICFDGHKMLLNLMMFRITPANCPIYYWWPFEGSAKPTDLYNCFEGVPEENLIHLSNFAIGLWDFGMHKIPHCPNPQFRQLSQSKNELRRKWAKRLKLPILEGSMLIYNINRNFFHKGWDNLFDLISRVKKVREVQVLCHTNRQVPENRGGFDLDQLSKLYGVEDELLVCDEKLYPEELNEFYNMADLRVDMSHGEGWGLTVGEAKAAGLPQILNDHTTMDEIASDDIRVKPSSYSYRMGTLWAEPDVNKMTEILVNWDEHKYDPKPLNDDYSITKIVDSWEIVLGQPYDGWKDHRYGYQARNGVRAANMAAAQVCANMGWSAANPACYDGNFVDYAMVLGVPVWGLEVTDNVNLDGMSERTKSQLKLLGNYADDWPESDVLVMTNCTDILLGAEDPEEVEEILRKIQSYENILILNEPCYKWGQLRFNPEQFMQYLESAGLEKQYEAEIVIRKKMDNFKHEIWSTQKLKLPKAFK